MATHVFRVKPGGRFGVIYDDAIRGLIRKLDPSAAIRRASDVEYDNDAQGWVATIRAWVNNDKPCTCVSNPPCQRGRHMLGPFESRAAALAAEVAYLHEAGL